MNQEFDGQREDEEVMFVFRRHVIAMRKGFYALLIPFAIASIPSLIWPGNLTLLWVALGGFVLGLLLFFYHWVCWYFTVFIVTNQRLRQTTQKGFFGKSVIDLGIHKIQNISYNIPGFTGEVFGFGTVVVQTYVGDLVLDKIHHPSEIHNQLQTIIQDSGSTQDLNEEIEA
jgi:hypothetical protein